MDKQVSHVKAVSYQEINELKDLMEKLDSWQEPLAILEHFFAFRVKPINKKQVIKEYYARAQLFHAFYEDYNRLVEVGDKAVQEMNRAKKIDLKKKLG
ncbi:hypothetical protein GIX45_27320 [Erwinia sp. CPCC 100877]|nr:hypothetical protein [Erwinia sp. CPCC 100877]